MSLARRSSVRCTGGDEYRYHPFMNKIFPTAARSASFAHAVLEDAFSYYGMCDASAAAALGPDLFVVANDERNQLQVYRRGVARHVAEVDLSPFLGTKKDKESDLEGAASVGERIYWISSHGRDKKGKFTESRHRFFATQLRNGELVPVGRPYAGLLNDMLAAPQLQRYPLAQASGLMPEADGAFNIEGLTATPLGALLIGLRNPVARGMALLIPLLNPAAVIDGETATLGEAIELDLGGLAIRSIDLVVDTYVIVAGPPADRGRFALFQWSGKAQERPVEVAQNDFGGLRPEGMFAIPNTRKLQILSDDGGKQAKDMLPGHQSFRSVTITL